MLGKAYKKSLFKPTHARALSCIFYDYVFIKILFIAEVSAFCSLGLTLNAQIATKVVCFSRLLKCLRSLYGKQCGPRSDCSSSLFWVHTVCFYT